MWYWMIKVWEHGRYLSFLSVSSERWIGITAEKIYLARCVNVVSMHPGNMEQSVSCSRWLSGHQPDTIALVSNYWTWIAIMCKASMKYTMNGGWSTCWPPGWFRLSLQLAREKAPLSTSVVWLQRSIVGLVWGSYYGREVSSLHGLTGWLHLSACSMDNQVIGRR